MLCLLSVACSSTAQDAGSGAPPADNVVAGGRQGGAAGTGGGGAVDDVTPGARMVPSMGDSAGDDRSGGGTDVCRRDPQLCVDGCTSDADCGGGPNVCTDDPVVGCAVECFATYQCGPEVCVLKKDALRDRVLSICSAPVGALPFGSVCMEAQDCESAVCAGPAGDPLACSALCVDDGDCAAPRPRCAGAEIPTPSAASVQMFRICT